MNDHSLTQLKGLVERAVRPVRASNQRKQAMRAELLAHVTAVFEDEAKAGDEAAALERTAARFGDPVELTQKLEESVPVGDALRRLWEDFVFTPGEPTSRRAFRHAAVVGLVTGAVLLVALFDSGQPSEWGSASLRFCGSVVLAMAGMAYGFHVLIDWVRRLMREDKRSWSRLGVVCVVGVALYACALMLPSLALDEEIRWATAPAALFFGVAMMALIFHLAPSTSVRLQQFREWAILPVDQGMRFYA